MSRISLSLKHARAISAYLKDDPVVSSVIDAAADELRRQLAPKPRSSAVKRTAAKKRSKRKETSSIYEEVAKRAGGLCECCTSSLLTFRPELDHFTSRRHGQSVETCWMLCSACHREKTDNSPSAAWWLERFISHCERNGYSAEAERARSRLEGIVSVREATR